MAEYQEEPTDQLFWDSCQPDLNMLDEDKTPEDLYEKCAEYIEAARGEEPEPGHHLRLFLREEHDRFDVCAVVLPKENCLSAKRQAFIAYTEALNTIQTGPKLGLRVAPPIVWDSPEDARAFSEAVNNRDWDRTEVLLELGKLVSDEDLPELWRRLNEAKDDQ